MMRNKELFSENLTYLDVSVVKIDHVNTVRRLVKLNVGIEVMDNFCSNSPLRGMFAVDRHDCLLFGLADSEIFCLGATSLVSWSSASLNDFFFVLHAD